MTAPDLFATDRCPVGFACETCGATDEDGTSGTPSGQAGPAARLGLAVATARSAAGVLCLTLCERCAAAGPTLGPLWWPPRMADGGARLVGLHCAHLGITLDEMAVALGGEDR